MVVVGADGLRSIKPFPPAPLSHCVFEHVYFARPDSEVFGQSVNEVRTELGRLLARETSVPADVVVPVPDSGVCAAIGYAEETRLPLRFGLIRNHYVGRTFIEPAQSIRHFGVKVKLNPVKSILAGQRVVLIDDSIVRGTTSRKIVKMVRAAGAREVHMRISCPPTDVAVLLRRGHAAAQRADRRDAFARGDSRATSAPTRSAISASKACCSRSWQRSQLYCTSCYTGKYPVAFPQDENAYLQLTLKLDDRPAPAARRRAGARGLTAPASPWPRRPWPWRPPSIVPAQERGPTPLSPADLACRHRSAGRHRLSDPDKAARAIATRAGATGGSGAAPCGRGARRRLHPLQGARPADRLRRPAHRGPDARGARRRRTIACARWRTATSSGVPVPRLTPRLLAALEKETGEFVRPALVRALAALGDQNPKSPRCAARGTSMRGARLLSQHGHRSARRLQGRATPCPD